MIRKIEAIYDGAVLRPAEPLDLKPNTRVNITVDIPAPEVPERGSFLDTALGLQLDGPPDWSSNVDSYLLPGVDASDA